MSDTPLKDAMKAVDLNDDIRPFGVDKQTWDKRQGRDEQPPEKLNRQQADVQAAVASLEPGFDAQVRAREKEIAEGMRRIQQVAAHGEKAAPSPQAGHQRAPSALEVLSKALALLIASHGRVLAVAEAVTGEEPLDQLMFEPSDGDPIATQIREISITITEVAHQIDSAMARIKAAL